MIEEIYFVSPHNNNMPFFINIAGVSYCDGSYHITQGVLLCFAWNTFTMDTEQFRAEEQSATRKQTIYTCFPTVRIMTITAILRRPGKKSGLTQQGLL